MSENQKKNTTTIVSIALALLVAAGGAYFVMNKGTAPEGSSATAEISVQSNDVATAAGEEKPAKESASTPQGQTASFEGVKVKPGNPIVAKVDGKEITRVDVYRYVQTMPANIQKLPATKVYPLAVEQVINTRVIQNKAETADLSDDPEVKQQLAIAKQQIMRGIYVQREVSKKISEGDVKKAYKKYISSVPDVEERNARHILVETEDEAKAVIAKLKEGADFAVLAKESSKGPTGSKGGDLGWFAKTDMVPEFAEVAFTSKKGSVTDTPVKTQFGWHVIKVEGVRQRAKPTIEQAKPMIEAELRRKALEGLVQDWRKKAKVEQFNINGGPLNATAPAAGN